MKVCLVNAPWYFEAGLEFLSQNLGLAYLAAALREKGHAVRILDAVAAAPEERYEVQFPYQTVYRFGLSYAHIAERIDSDTELIGVNIPFTNHWRIAEEIVPVLKARHPQARIVLGGVFPSTLPEAALACGADVVLGGEGEPGLLRLAAGEAVETIPGAWTAHHRPAAKAENPVAKHLDDLPLPARDLLPMEQYLQHSARGLKGRRTASLITSRGCPFDCRFCSVHPVCSRHWRSRSPENVLAEVEQLVGEYQVNHLELEDDNFTLQADRAGRILEGLVRLREKGIDLSWETPNGVRVDTLNEEFFRLAQRSGCRRLYLAVEHGDPEMLELMNKRLDLAKVESAVREAKRAGVSMLLFFMVGYPGETEERFERALQFFRRMRKLGAERVEAFIAKPYPGTWLSQYCTERNYLVHPNSKEIVYTIDYAGIATPEFTPADVRRRKARALAELNPWVYRWRRPLEAVFPRAWLRAAKRMLGVG